MLKGLHQVVPGEFYAAATRPPAVYRGNPFQIEVGIAYRRPGCDAKCRQRLAPRSDRRDRRPHDAAVFDSHVQRPGLATRPTGFSKTSGLGTRQSPRLEAEGSRQAARGDEERERCRRADDGSAAVCQSRAAAIPAGQLCDHANDPGHELAELRPVAIARRAAEGAGHRDGPHGERVGAVHQRIERSDRQLSGNSKRAAARACKRSAASWACTCGGGCKCEARRRTAADFPALSGRSGDGGERNQCRRSSRAVRAAA